MQHEAILYRKEKNNSVVCELCPRACHIAEGKAGYCGPRRNEGGTLYATGYGQMSSIGADPIEKKPLFNFYPGSRVLSAGGLGCNLCCKHCQNWSISQARGDKVNRATEYISPEQFVALAVDQECQGIAWTYNEPTINAEYMIDSGKLALEKGLYTVAVTNGYVSEKGLDAIGPYVQAYSVDIKGYSDRFYKEVSGVPSIKPVLESTIRAKQKWGMHVEVVTNLIPTYNDDPQELDSLAQWIIDNVGVDTPWHISAFHPDYKLTHVPATPASALKNARGIGLTAGLHYVYTGNVPGDQGENTFCPSCGKQVIERIGYMISQMHLKDGACGWCGEKIVIR